MIDFALKLIKDCTSNQDSDNSSFFYKAVVKGTLYGKANSRQVCLNKRTGTRFIRKQDGALKFEKDFMLQIKPPVQPYEGDVSISATVYYPNRRQDLEIELLKDCIEKVGILKNDKQIVHYGDVWRRIDKENPRVVFAVRAVDGQA